jgi:5'-nucleotidase
MKLFKRCYFVIILLLLVLLTGSCETARATDQYEVTFVGINDMHSHIFPDEVSVNVDGKGNKQEVGGLARIGTVIKDIKRDDQGNVMAVSLGDINEGPLFYFFHGKAEMVGLNAAGVDVGILGNHEFDLGLDVIKETLASADFPILSPCNVDFASADVALHFFPEPYFVKTMKNGTKVGCFSLLCTELTTITNSGPLVKVEQDLTDVARRAVADLQKKGCHIIVALTHIGLDADRSLAASVEGIHAILGAHTHDALERPVIVEGPHGWKTMIGQAGSMCRYAGIMKLVVDEKGMLNENLSGWTLLEMNQSVPRDQDVQKVIRPYAEKLKSYLDRPVGKLMQDGDATKPSVRSEESALGNFLADAMRWKGGTRIAFLNGGGIRGNRIYPAGEISYNTLYEIYPWGNTLQKFTLSGKDIRQTLEVSASALKGPSDNYDTSERTPSGGFLQVSGLRVIYDLSEQPALIDNNSRILKAGNRVETVNVRNDKGQWVPLDDDEQYTVTTTGWTGSGGDKHYILAGKNGHDTCINDVQALMEYIVRSGNTVDLSLDGRITLKGTGN